jgi:hypothetical protein
LVCVARLIGEDVTRIFHIDFANRVLTKKEDLPDSEAAPTSEQLSEKPKFFLALLDKEVVEISFDTTFNQVILPNSLKSNKIIKLKWSRKFQIPDFGIDNSGVFGTLSFAGEGSFVYVPWEAVIKIEGATSKVEKIW